MKKGEIYLARNVYLEGCDSTVRPFLIVNEFEGEKFTAIPLTSRKLKGSEELNTSFTSPSPMYLMDDLVMIYPDNIILKLGELLGELE